MSDKEEIESDAEEDQNENDLTNPEIVTKYKLAGDIANRVCERVAKESVAGKKIVELCALGDSLINEGVANIYNKAKVERGVAFPTCVSVNNCVGHNSPLISEDSQTLQPGDVVKIDLGVHIDGYIALVANTIAVPEEGTPANTPVTGRKADVICAAFYGAELAIRLLKPGTKNSEISEVIRKAAEAFGCQPMEAVLSHQMKRYVIDGNKVISNKPTLEQRVDEFIIEPNEVYHIDVVMSTGEGKGRETESRTTIFKRQVDVNYLLKLKASRYVFNEINAKFPTLPFTIRALDEKKGRLGMLELLNHDLVVPYPVLYEKPSEHVAQFKFSAMVQPNGTLASITANTPPFVKSEKSIEDPQLKQLLQTTTKKKKSKSKKKKKAPATAAAAGSSTEKADDDDEGDEEEPTMDTAS